MISILGPKKSPLSFWALLALVGPGVEGVYEYSQWQFEERVQKTLDNLYSILNETKTIQKANEQDHTYDDKYLLAELVTLSTWDSLEEAFGLIGLNLTNPGGDVSEGLSLNLDAKSECSLVSEEEVDVKGDGMETTNSLGIASVTRKVHRVTQYKWSITETYEMFICFGGGTSCESKKRKVLKGRSMSSTVVSTTSSCPSKNYGRALPTATFELGWLLKRLNQDEGTFDFKIDRNAKSCKTPRRNENLDDVIKFHSRLLSWLGQVENYLHSIYVPPNYDGASLRNEILDLKVDWLANVPLFENSTVLSAHTVQQLREKERDSLAGWLSKTSEVFPPSGEKVPISALEAFILVFARHTSRLLFTHQYSVDFVEMMLRDQLEQAVGKYLEATDFRNYMNFHSQEFLAADFAPDPFSIVIRHGDAAPVGSFSIEEFGSEGYEPAQLMRRTISAKGLPPIRIPIDASTSVEVTGDRHLSGWIQYQFGGSSSSKGNYRLACHARQFSSFILVIGTITGANSFQPKNAILLQNKDEVLIPLSTEVLPSAKEFKDAISSLSPEQQRFAKSFRAMQLESSVFGVCIVQLKPQFEKLLNLPSNSLAKEIELTETLTKLFVDYQIPSDLLSFDGEQSMNTTEKVLVVKDYVGAVTRIVDSLKQKVVEEEKEKGETRKFMRMDGMVEPEVTMMYAASASATRKVRTARASPTASPTASPSMTSSSYESSSGESSRYDSAQSEGETTESPAKPQDETDDDDESSEGGPLDFTKLPKILDRKLEKYDLEGFLRSVIIKSGENWTRKRKANMLAEATTQHLDSETIRSEQRTSFDLLDAISKSGSLAIDSAELHVIVGVSHNFVNSLMETVYKDNINPIEKAEKTMLLFASQIFEDVPRKLLHNAKDLKRLEASFPELIREE
mmetsp:Transcript_13631/g.37675  ORF Transcript_13631/g.37675 Transcript_13631/m.37675 type:complete len:908 (-) Transcript_13631:687-3410(-)